jgi:hypothetical protein
VSSNRDEATKAQFDILLQTICSSCGVPTSISTSTSAAALETSTLKFAVRPLKCGTQPYTALSLKSESSFPRPVSRPLRDPQIVPLSRVAEFSLGAAAELVKRSRSYTAAVKRIRDTVEDSYV